MTLPFAQAPLIEGMVLVPDFLSEPSDVLQAVDGMPWMYDLSRRVQHYGWKYDYRSHIVRKDAYLGPLPSFLAAIAGQLYFDGLMRSLPDQAIVNEYVPGQGISAHVDCEPCFGPEVATLSLGDEYPMRFSKSILKEVREFWLPVGSACVISGPARYEWTHEIAKRKSDVKDGVRKPRLRRVSITFRTVISSSPQSTLPG